MKKLLLLLFSIFFLSSPSVFAETYFCVDESGNPDILKRQGSEFSYKSRSEGTLSEGTLKIVHEDSQYLFLMGNFSKGATVYALNKISNETTALWISPDKGKSSELYPGTCIKN